MNRSLLRPILAAILLRDGASQTQTAIQTIDFDSEATGNPINAPNLFSAATPLTDLYAGNGGHLYGSNPHAANHANS
jgi:hypothetical protein